MVITARTAAWLAAIVVGVFAWIYYMKSEMPAGVPMHETHAGHARHDDSAVSRIVSATFDADGTLYAVEAASGHVLFSRSEDEGRTFSEPVAVTPEPERLDANGEARPKVAIGPGGEVLVSWTRRGEALYTGDIRFARSTDGGRTFSRPTTINDDGLPIGHRFDSLGVAPDGTVVIAWIDKRDLERAIAADQPYAGAAVYVATSRDAGATFSTNRKVRDHSCECCRIAMAFDADSTPVLFWRHVLPGGIRDHVVARLDGAGTPEPARVGQENWQIDACPHHGPALAIAPGGRHHFAWFTGADSTGEGVRHAYSDDGGRTVSEPRPIGTGALAGHPSLAVARGQVWLAWKEWHDEATVVFVMSSADDGASWSEPRRLAVAGPNSDRPFLITRGDAVYLSWADPARLRIVRISGG